MNRNALGLILHFYTSNAANPTARASPPVRGPAVAAAPGLLDAVAPEADGVPPPDSDAVVVASLVDLEELDSRSMF